MVFLKVSGFAGFPIKRTANPRDGQNGETGMKKMLLTVSAALLLSVGLAHAADPPDVKEGLWSIHTQTIDQPGDKKS
jgi:hypothetical protein